MVSSSLWSGVAEVLNLVKEHSEKYKPPRSSTTKLERLSGWAVLVGGLACLAGEVLRQIGDPNMPSRRLAYVALLIFGLALFFAGTVGIVVDFVRTTRRPFVEHLSGIIGALDREHELIGALVRFEAVTLGLACERLKLESAKVSTRLAMIGGGEGLKTSLLVSRWSGWSCSRSTSPSSKVGQ